MCWQVAFTRKYHRLRFTKQSMIMSQGLILSKRPRDERMARFQVMGTSHAGVCDRLVDRLSTETGSLCCRYCRRKKEDSGDRDYRWHWKLRGLGQLVGLRLSSCMLSIRSVTVPAILESRSVGSRRESLERESKRARERD